jgi:hypothetical protein
MTVHQKRGFCPASLPSLFQKELGPPPVIFCHPWLSVWFYYPSSEKKCSKVLRKAPSHRSIVFGCSPVSCIASQAFDTAQGVRAIFFLKRPPKHRSTPPTPFFSHILSSLSLRKESQCIIDSFHKFSLSIDWFWALDFQ